MVWGLTDDMLAVLVARLADDLRWREEARQVAGLCNARRRLHGG